MAAKKDASNELELLKKKVQALTKEKEILLSKIEELENSNFLLYLPFENIFIHENGICIDVNESFLKLSGYSRNEVIGKDIIKMFVLEKYIPIVYEHTQKDYVKPYRIEVRTKNGEILTIELEARSKASQKDKTRVVAFRDVTDQINIENALCESEAKLNNAMKVARLGHWEYDVAKDVFIFNDNFYAIFHTNVQKVGGYVLSSAEYAKRFVHPDDAVLVGEEIGRAIMSEDPNFCGKIDHRIIYADGGIGYISVCYYLVKDDNGKTIRTQGVNQEITERKLVEEALLKSRETLSRVTSSIEDVIYSIDVQTGEFEYLSPAFEKKFGYTLADIHQKGGRLAFLKQVVQVNQSAGNVLEEFKKNKIEKTPVWEHWWRCKDGSFLFIEDRSVPIYEGDRLIRVDGVLRDITERKQAEDALHDERKLLRIIVDNIPVGLYIKDTEGRKVMANLMDLRMIGKPESEVIGKTDMEFLPREIAEKTLADDLSVVKTGEPITREELIKNDNGESRWVLTTKIPRKNSDNEIIGIIGMGLDITGRKQAEEEKQESEEKFRNAFQFAPFAMALLDRTGRFVQVNPSFCRLLGYSDEELMQKTFHEITHPDDVEKGIEPVKNLYKGSTDHFWLEKRYVHKNNSVIWAFLSASAIRNKDGKLIYTIAQIQDITERKAHETELKIREELLRTRNEELLKAKEKAEESDHLKSAFLANMSHEIRTPMNAIIGFTEFLLKPNLSEAKKQRFSSLIRERTYDLLRILEDILDISKIEVGQMTVIESDTYISDLMNELFDYYNFKKGALAKKLELNVKVAGELKKIKVKTDGQRLKQILNNLLDNALKFTQNGGIELGCEVDSEKNLKFYVKDTGIGIPPEKQKIVFDRFRQAEDSLLARNYGGTGLGLSIARGLVQLMHGKIWLESKEGEGTTFYFTLPFNPLSIVDENQSGTDNNRASDWRHKLVLIVEDDKANMEYMNEALSETGLQIKNAYSGDEALEIFKSTPSICLVLMDIRLTDINGLDLTRIMKKIRPELIVIAQTAYASPNDYKECIDAGCNEFISKPINQDKLISLLSQFLNKK